MSWTTGCLYSHTSRRPNEHWSPPQNTFRGINTIHRHCHSQEVSQEVGLRLWLSHSAHLWFDAVKQTDTLTRTTAHPSLSRLVCFAYVTAKHTHNRENFCPLLNTLILSWHPAAGRRSWSAMATMDRVVPESWYTSRQADSCTHTDRHSSKLTDSFYNAGVFNKLLKPLSLTTAAVCSLATTSSPSFVLSYSTPPSLILLEQLFFKLSAKIKSTSEIKSITA